MDAGRVDDGGDEGSPHSLGYEPALDGIRALAVMAVLFFHARFGWARGGFLGVSVFFTLSGFLITSLLVREHAATGTVSMRRFWVRRARRLLPAAWLTIAVVLVIAALDGFGAEQLRDLRGDVPAALAQVANWHFVLSDRSYADLFAAPSPLEHYWSLSIEEQYYLVFPVVMAGLLAWLRGRRLPLATGLGLVAAASATWCGVVATRSVDRAYFGTDTRMAELAIGALLAVLTARRLGARRSWTRQARVAGGWAGLGLLAAMASTLVVTADALYPWGLLATSAASVALIAGALEPGTLQRALATRPLVLLGRISYGVYLLHWPVFVWLTPQRTGWEPWPLFVARMALTLAGATAMYHLVEWPIRRHGLGRRLRPLVVAPAGAFAIVVATLVVTADLPPPSALADAASTPVTVPPERPTRILVVGDQLAGSLEPGMAATRSRPVEVRVEAAPDCGLTTGGWVRLADSSVERDRDRCEEARERQRLAVTEFRPDVIVVWGGLRDVADRRLSTDTPWRAPGDRELDDFLRADLGGRLDELGGTGAGLVVLTVPPVANRTAPTPLPPPASPNEARSAQDRLERAGVAREVPPPGFAENDPSRIGRWNELLAEVAGRRGVGIVDAAGQMASWPDGPLDPTRRPDGVALSSAASRELADWLVPELEGFRRRAPAATPQPLAAAAAPLPAAPPAGPRRVVPAPGRVQMLVVGDSLAFGIGYGLNRWSEEGSSARVQNAGQFGCPVARGGSYRFLREVNEFLPGCDWATLFPRFLDQSDPDVVVLATGIWEVVDRILPGDDRWRRLGEEQADRYLLRELLVAIDSLASGGARVVVLTAPHLEAGRDQGYADLPESDPARVDALNRVLVEAAARRPGVVTVIDLQGWLASQPGGELDPAKRSDGIHFTDEYSEVVGAWLGPQLLQLARGAS